MSEPNTEAEPGPKREVSPARLDANRANSLKSTGPRTPEGKEASRLNGLVHGLRAELAIIPGEDPEALRRRLDVWTDQLGAETESERYLAEAAVNASWRMDRCRAAEAAALTRQVLKAGDQLDQAQAGEVERLVARLEQEPAEVVRRLRQSSLGCLWLLGQWGELAGRLRDWKCVEPSQRLHAIHLMGKQTNDVFDPIVSRWVAAYLGALMGDAQADVGRACNLLATHRADGMSAAEFERRIELLCKTLPDTVGGNVALTQVVVEAIAELTERLELIEVRERRDRELAVSCAAFDATPAGASRLRYEMSHERVFRASLRDLRTMQNGRPNPGGAATVAPTEPKPGSSPAQPRSTHGETVEPGEARVNDIHSASTGPGVRMSFAPTA